MKKIFIRLMLSMLTVALMFTVCACGNNEAQGEKEEGSYSLEFEKLLQNQAPAAGEKIAVMETSMGTIKIRFFPEIAPKAVENFITLSEDGYYDGISFHRIINGFMIQGGDPEGTGRGGESCWGRSFEDEFSDYLFNFRGALSMANAGPNTNGSQFFIVQANEVSANMLRQMKDSPYFFPPEITEAYARLGGTPWLDFRHTVFGQVINGMDVVDAIANVAVGANDKPVNDVVILGIDIIVK